VTDHKPFDYRAEWHKGDAYGCYFKHDGAGFSKYPKCDYPLNGFEEAKQHTGMYNRDHRNAAGRKGYFSDKVPQLQAQVSALGAARGKDSGWEQRTMDRVYQPIRLLLADPQAWHIKHHLTQSVTPWWPKGGAARVPPAENFLPRPHGGWHYYFPYKHNHHHMISAGSFREFVLDAPVSGKATRFTRRIVILKADWNINRKQNLVMLPNEEAVAEICALPAHCPWDAVSHPDYSSALKSDLAQVRDAIDKAADKDKHEELEDVTIVLEETEKMLRNKIARMRGPL
jgi:hypothetical protein